MRTEKEIWEDIRIARNRLGELEAEFEAARLEGLGFPYQIGDRIQVLSGQQATKVFELTEVRLYDTFAALDGRPIKKDGTPYARSRYIGLWSKKEAENYGRLTP